MDTKTIIDFVKILFGAILTVIFALIAWGIKNIYKNVRKRREQYEINIEKKFDNFHDLIDKELNRIRSEFKVVSEKDEKIIDFFNKEINKIAEKIDSEYKAMRLEFREERNIRFEDYDRRFKDMKEDFERRFFELRDFIKETGK